MKTGEDIIKNRDEEDRRLFAKFESYISNEEFVSKILDDPGLLEQVCSTAWWSQPATHPFFSWPSRVASPKSPILTAIV